ncbi:MAG: mechanosensitive ion channel family protein [Muribaculaceae bacterium]|nr:mechanosensitive ion channel family protein [Muribaculaceae bacterium]
MIPLLISPENSVALPGAETVGLHLSQTTEESSYFIAKILMECVYWVLNVLGLGHHPTLFLVIYAALVFLISWGIGSVVKWILVAILNKIGPHVKNNFYQYLVSRHFFTKLCRIVPPLLFLIFIQFTLNNRVSLAAWLSRITWIYIVYVVSRTFTTLADVIWNNVNDRANKRKLPLNGVVQLIKLVIWIIALIIIFGILLDKSPGSMLAGLGAFSAVLMLIFKDNILGVVAGVQLAENDSLHEGDWIAPNGSDANGTVVDVSLTAIKIQNWDKTISTIPPYSLISQGFKNYRSMQLSNTRRIQRSYMIDADSIVATTDEMLAEFAKIPLLKDWIEKKIEQRNAGKVENVNNSAELVDGTIDTNLGVFRAYLKLYLDTNPHISHNDDCFVTTLAQAATGVPLQLYCFTSTSKWFPYEAIQASVFEHVAVMLYQFKLYTFEYPTGRDTIIEGFVPGKHPEDIFGMPYHLYQPASPSADRTSAQTAQQAAPQNPSAQS